MRGLCGDGGRRGAETPRRSGVPRVRRNCGDKLMRSAEKLRRKRSKECGETAEKTERGVKRNCGEKGARSVEKLRGKKSEECGGKWSRVRCQRERPRLVTLNIYTKVNSHNRYHADRNIKKAAEPPVLVSRLVRLQFGCRTTQAQQQQQPPCRLFSCRQRRT